MTLSFKKSIHLEIIYDQKRVDYQKIYPKLRNKAKIVGNLLNIDVGKGHPRII